MSPSTVGVLVIGAAVGADPFPLPLPFPFAGLSGDGPLPFVGLDGIPSFPLPFVGLDGELPLLPLVGLDFFVFAIPTKYFWNLISNQSL